MPLIRPLSNPVLQGRINHLAAKTAKLATLVASPEASDPPPDRRLALTPDQAEALLAAYQAGTPLKDLRAQFHISQRTIYRHIQQAGLSRRPRRRLSPEDVAEAAELYNQGATLKQLGVRYGLDDETVRVRLVEAGVQLRRRGSRPRAAEP